MGKVYKFPTRKQTDVHNDHYSKNRTLMKNAIDILLGVYEHRMKELADYISHIESIDGTKAQNPKQLILLVKEINDMFEASGIKNDFYTFTAEANQIILYFVHKNLVYVYNDKIKNNQRRLTRGEFISEFEGQCFVYVVEKQIYRMLEKRIEELRITIETLNNTVV